MRGIYCGAAAFIGASTIGAPALAGEQVIYEAEPAWVVPAEIEPLLKGPEEIVLLDRQRLLKNGAVHAYEDVAIRLMTPDAVTKLNTINFQWLPDKGDLTVHRLQIHRAGKVIDLLADGSRFSVLRRETQLERREVNGALTATLPVAGLQVGDVLRLTRSISSRDQAFADDLQLVDGLVVGPQPVGMARELVSWPAGDDVKWKATGEVSVDGPDLVDGYRRLSISLPLDKQPEMPADSPLRYRLQPLLQATTFDSWRDVSATMAPHFQTEGTIEPEGPIAGEIARIERATSDPLERAALALQLVQDEISYLANGMDGGNYQPQQPAETWAIRYGDCKAKSFLLAAMLHEMGIEADVVVVSTTIGDAVASLLPQPSNFNHMIVRAKIGGTDYWLDGTGAGTRLSTLAEVPAFEYALPLSIEGSDLVTIEQRWQPAPDRILRLTYDFTAGFDLPAIYDADIELVGTLAAQVRSAAAETDEEKQRDFVEGYMDKMFKDSALVHGSVTYDEAAGTARIRARGEYSDEWTIENGKASYTPALASTGLEFAPDRGRSLWKDVPVQLGGPVRYREEVTILLPEIGSEYKVAGIASFSDVVAGRKIERTVTVHDERIEIVDDMAMIPTEITPDKFAAERAKTVSLRSGDPRIETAAESFYWTLDDEAFRKRTKRLEEAYAAVIDHTPDEAWIWSRRAWLRSLGPDKTAALADMTKAIEIDGTGDRYLARAQLYSDLGRDAEALEDAREAFTLDPDPDNAIFLASTLAKNGTFDEALTLLEELDVSGDERMSAILTRAEIFGQAQRLDEGWALLESALAERPGSEQVLNSQCWYAGTWKYKLEEATDICTRAVQASQWSPAALDSRALAYYRLGKTDEAIADLDAALRNQPLLAASRYLRGIIKTETGSAEGRAEIADAVRLAPSVEDQYRRYGISAPK